MPSQMARVAALAEYWRAQLLDLLYPSRCVNCHRMGEPLCSICLSSIRFVSPPCCPRCSRPLMIEGEPCLQCRTFPLHLVQIRAVAYHEGAMREAIHAFKYRHRTELAAPLTVLLQENLERSAINLDIITAVPLHPRRQVERGYNQADLLTKLLAHNVGLPYVDGLRRIRPTKDQIGLDVAARHENMRAAFEADPASFLGRRVLIVDDVCTTGATLDDCAVALASQGARSIYGLTVARAR
jgi:ComF family protein